MLIQFAPAAVAAAQEVYQLGKDSQIQPGVPRGTVTKYSFTSPAIYPGTVRDYWIYVPAQYDASKPACAMVYQDGQFFIGDDGNIRAPLVMDNLIHQKRMPVTVGILVSPGVLPALDPSQQNRYNRSYEYDNISDRYSRFLIEELLPEVSKTVNLSNDPNDWAICGLSSGGICAFNAAWHRPDRFRRVVSFIGSYVNLRGGHNLATAIRKMEPKPLRVFLQDGSNDNNIYAGSWWISNQDMNASLEFCGYDVKFVTGTEAHNMKHGAAVLPEAFEWVWRDHGQPIAKPRGKNERFFFNQFVDPGSEWQPVSANHKFTEGPAVAPNGDVYFTDVPGEKIWKIEHASAKVSLFRDNSGRANGMMFGPDGRLYVCQGGPKRIVSYGMDGTEKVLAEDITSNDLCVTAKGDVYVTDPPTKKVWLIAANGNRREVITEGIEFPNGVIASPDHAQLYVADMRNKWVWAYQIQQDGSLKHGQPFCRMELWDENSQSGADGMTVDSEGFLYVATRLGLQICDQPGRVVAILSKPHAGALSNAVFGGPQLDTIYATAGDRVFRRVVKRRGVWPWKGVKPPQPRL
jgi:gluconolactonase